MIFKSLGCYGAQLPAYRTTSFLIDDHLLVDAGAVTLSLTMEEQANIKNILIFNKAKSSTFNYGVHQKPAQ